MNTRTPQRLAAAGMASAAGLAIAGFTALGSIFDYPNILEEPTADILTLFRENQPPSPRGSWCWPSAPGCWLQSDSCSVGSPAEDAGGGSPSSAWPQPPCRSSD